LIPETEPLVCPGSGGRALEKCVTATTHCNSTMQQEQHNVTTRQLDTRKRSRKGRLQLHSATAHCNCNKSLERHTSLTHGRALGKCAPTRCKSTLQLQTHTVRQHVATVHCSTLQLQTHTMRQHVARVHCNCKHTLQQHTS